MNILLIGIFVQSKAIAKGSKAKYQWQIMKSLGFEDDEQIRSFEDPLTWLNYFPPLAVNDLKSIGIHVSMLNKMFVQFL